MNYSDVKFDTIPDVFSWELTDQAALLSNDSKRTTDYIDYNYGSESYWGTTLRAKAALNRNSPQEALALNANEPRKKYRRLHREQEFIEASALQKLGQSKKAISLVDKYLNLKPYDTDDDDYDQVENRLQTISNHYNRLLLLVKANALCDIGQYKRALSLCNSMLTQNSHLIEPRLINIRSYQGLKDTKAATEESEKITSELAAWMNSAEVKTHD